MALSLVTTAVSSWFSTTTPRSMAASSSWVNGDYVYVIGHGENSTLTLGTPTITGLSGTSLTFSLIDSITTLGTEECSSYLWRAIATGTGSGTIQVNRATGSGMFGGRTIVISGGATGHVVLTATRSETAYNQAISAGDIVIWSGSDWNATNPPTKVPLTATGTTTEHDEVGNTNNYGVITYSWTGSTAAGTYDFGPALAASPTTPSYTNLRISQLGVVVTAPTGGAASSLILPRRKVLTRL